MSKIIHTKWGNASINSRGYYKIHSNECGCSGKSLHRLIWEEHYNKKVPDGYVIHHKDGNKLNNDISNLQCCEHGLHNKFHQTGRKNPEWSKKMTGSGNPMYGMCGEKHPRYGKPLSDETKKKLSDSLSGRRLSANTKKKISESLKKDYPRKVKNGFNSQGKQRYAIKYDGRIIVESVDEEKIDKKLETFGEWFVDEPL